MIKQIEYGHINNCKTYSHMLYPHLTLSIFVFNSGSLRYIEQTETEKRFHELKDSDLHFFNLGESITISTNQIACCCPLNLLLSISCKWVLSPSCIKNPATYILSHLKDMDMDWKIQCNFF